MTRKDLRLVRGFVEEKSQGKSDAFVTMRSVPVEFILTAKARMIPAGFARGFWGTLGIADFQWVEFL
jgi:hypothetical protein